MKPFGSRERVVWTVVTAVLLAGLAFFALSPRLLAGSTEDETQAYIGTIGDMMRYIRDNYVDANKAQPKALYEGAMKGMFEALGDPNSAVPQRRRMAEDLRHHHRHLRRRRACHCEGRKGGGAG